MWTGELNPVASTVNFLRPRAARIELSRRFHTLKRACRNTGPIVRGHNN